jgi:hypothetical protein
MKKMILFSLLALAPAFAGTTTCFGLRDYTMPVMDNLDVPAGKVCTLAGTEVFGNVTVEGTLISYSTHFRKNVTVTGNGIIQIFNGNGAASAIEGNLNISSTGGSWSTLYNAIYCPNISNIIRGNLNVTDSSTPFFSCSAAVDGAANFTGNTGGLALYGIGSGKGLNCSENVPAPTGGNNSGIKNGQCAGL